MSAFTDIMGLRYVLSADTTSLNSGLAAAEASMGRTSGTFTKAAALITTATAVGLGALGHTALTAGMKYEDALNIFDSVSKATDAQMQQVAETARELGNDLTLPGTSAGDAALAMTELAKGGLDVQESMEAAKGTLQLAAAAGIEAAQAAEYQAQTLNAFGLEGSEAARVADVLSNAANAASGEITDFALGMSQASAVASSTGISLEDTAATLGVLAKNGILGSDAGTLMKSALLALQSPSEAAAGAMEDLGLKAYDATGNFVGMESIFGQLAQAQKSMTPEMYAMAASTLFGSDAARLAGIAGREGAEGFALMQEAMSQQGSAADVSAAKNKGLSGAIDGLKSQIETTAIDVYNKFSPMLNEGVRSIAEWIPKAADTVKDFFSTLANNEYVRTGVQMLVSGIKDLAGFVKDSLLPAAGNLAQAFGPALGAALGGILFAFQGIASVLRDYVGPALEAVTGWLKEHETTASVLAGVVGGVLATAMGIWATQSTIAAAKNTAAWFTTALSSEESAKKQGKSAFQIIFHWAVMGTKAAAHGAKVAAVWTVQMAGAAARGAASLAVSAAKGAASFAVVAARATATGAVMAAQAAGTAAKVVASWVVMGAQALVQAARMAAAWVIAMGPVGWVIAAVVGLVALIAANWEKVKAATVAVWDWIWGKIKGVGEWILNLFKNWSLPGLIVKHWDSIKNGAKAAWDWVVNLISGVPGKIVGFFTGAGRWLVDTGKNILTGLWEGISGTFSWIYNKVKGFFLGLLPGWVKDMLGIHSPSRVFAEIGAFTGEGFGVGFEDSMAGVKKAMATSVQDASDLAALHADVDGSVVNRIAGGSLAGSGSGSTVTNVNVGGIQLTFEIGGPVDDDALASIEERAERAVENALAKVLGATNRRGG